MATNGEKREIARKIRMRAQEYAVTGDRRNWTAEAEVFACLADGTLTFEDLKDEALEDYIRAFGADYVLDALIAGESGAAEADRVEEGVAEVAPSGYVITEPAVARRRRVWLSSISSWRSPVWIAAAAMAAIVAIFSYFVSRRSDHRLVPPANAEIHLALQWPSRAPFNPEAVKTWGPRPARLPRGGPDFSKSTATLGASGDDQFARWRLATAIVRTGNGWGSGTFISADGWLLTNYHVVSGPAQDAALTGDPATVDVIAGRLVDGRVKPRPALKAKLYRADPIRDLALLKLDALPSDIKQMPYFRLGAQVRDGEDCFVVGSQNNGPAWWIRSGNVSQEFDFPDDLSQFAAGAVDGGIMERNHATVIVTDTRVSSGDSGGPLLNAKGELIGLTFATPGNLSAGSVGWHVALPHLRTFLADLPNEPEGVPFDVWTAGLPDAVMLQPEQLAGRGRDADTDSLLYRYASPARESESPQPVAETVFVDFHRRPEPNRGGPGLVPFGLWGVDSRAQFRFDLFLATRADGITVTGYGDQQGVVDDIRIGHSGEEEANLTWRRDQAGKWHAARPSAPIALIDAARLGRTNLNRLQAVAGQMMTASARSGQTKLRGEPNKEVSKQ